MNEKIVMKTALQPFLRVIIQLVDRYSSRSSRYACQGYARSVNSEKRSLKIIEEISGIVKIYRTILFYSHKTVSACYYFLRAA